MILRLGFFAAIFEGDSLRFKWLTPKAPPISKDKIKAYEWHLAEAAELKRRQDGFDKRWTRPSQIVSTPGTWVMDSIVSIDPWDTPDLKVGNSLHIFTSEISLETQCPKSSGILTQNGTSGGQSALPSGGSTRRTSRVPILIHSGFSYI